MTDQTLDELLSDPMILSLMKADRVDPDRLRAEFGRIALQLGPRHVTRRRDEPTDWKRLLDDCLAARSGTGPRVGA